MPASTSSIAPFVTSGPLISPGETLVYSIERYARVNLGDSLSTTHAWLPVAMVQGHYLQDAIERYFKRHPDALGGRYRVLRDDEYGLHGEEFDVSPRSAPTIKRLRDMRDADERPEAA